MSERVEKGRVLRPHERSENFHEVHTSFPPKQAKGRSGQELSALLQEAAHTARASGKRFVRVVYDSGIVQTFKINRAKNNTTYDLLLLPEDAVTATLPKGVISESGTAPELTAKNTHDVKRRYEYTESAEQVGALARDLSAACFGAQRAGKTYLRVAFRNGTRVYKFRKTDANTMPPQYELLQSDVPDDFVH